MATYRVELTASARKAIKQLPRDVQTRIAARLRQLSANPRGQGCTKMRGHTSEYRTRVGDYRVRYLIQDDLLVVIVIEVAHRKDIYRPF